MGDLQHDLDREARKAKRNMRKCGNDFEDTFCGCFKQSKTSSK